MENKIKLRPKQLATLSEIATKRQQLNGMLQELSKQELLIVELIFEEAGVDKPVKNININNEDLTYEFVEEKKATPKGKVKKLKAEVE